MPQMDEEAQSLYVELENAKSELMSIHSTTEPAVVTTPPMLVETAGFFLSNACCSAVAASDAVLSEGVV